MSGKKPNHTSKFVTTFAEWQWDGDKYVLIYREGYEYDGPWALAHDVDAQYQAEDYRWRNDDGSITTATWIAAENTAVTTGVSPGDNVRLRVNFAETATAAGSGLDTGGWTLQFQKNAESWTTVGAATDVKYYNSSNLTNGTAIETANHVLTYSGPEAQRNWGDENEDGVTPSQTWSNDVAEAEFSIQFDATNTAASDSITFRLLGPDASVVVFDNVPTITLVAASADVTRDPPLGTVAITEYAPVAILGTNIAVPVGALAFTSYPAPWVLQPGQYGVKITGYEPTVDVPAGEDHTRAPGAGSLALAGAAPSAEEDHNALPGVDTLALAGQAPSVGEDHVIEVPTGSLTLASAAPVVLVTISALPGIDTLVLAGQIPSIGENHIRAPPTYGLTATGQTPVALSGANVTKQPGIGTLALSGQVPSAEESHTATPNIGTMSLSGAAPTVTVGVSIPVPVGALTATGYAAPWVLQPNLYGLKLVGYEPTATDSGDTSKTADPPAGALAITGYAPSLEYDWTGLPGTDSLTITGYAPALSYSWITPTPVGSLSVTGYAPTVQVSLTVNPGAGSLTLAGSAPTIGGAVTAAPGTGTLSITGYIPVVDDSGDSIIPVPTGSLALSGYSAPWVLQPNLYGLKITGYEPQAVDSGGAAKVPGVGSLALTGYAPTALNSGAATAQPGVGSLTFTGEPPAWYINIVGAESSLYFTGFAPTVDVDQVVAPGVGALTLSGKVPTVAAEDVTRSPGLGTLALSGKVPSLAYSWVIDAPVGALTLAGIQPATGAADTIPVPAGTLSLSGKVPSCIEAFSASTGAGSLLIGGKVPSLAYSWVIPVGSGALVAQGYAPTALFSSPLLAPGTDALSITGYAPVIGVAEAGTSIVNLNATTDDIPNNYEQCDRTGFRQYPEDMIPDGYGGYVRKRSYESKHPQDNVRSRGGDKQRGSVSPEQDDRFLSDGEVTVDDL